MENTEPPPLPEVQPITLTYNFAVVWNNPILPKDFEYPVIATCLTSNSPRLEGKRFIHHTGHHKLLEKARIELAERTLHPACNDFVAREIFDQWMAVTNSPEFLTAEREYLIWKKQSR